MLPDDVDLSAGLCGLALVPEKFGLGRGVVISRIDAHFIAPFMMAFASPLGKDHLVPWQPAKGGIELDLTAELFLPASAKIEHLDRRDTVWWIAALMRLRTGNTVSVPVVSSDRFASIPGVERQPQLWPVEIHRYRPLREGEEIRNVDVPELEWLRKNWHDGATLLNNQDFSLAFQSIDSSAWNHSSALAFGCWGALERLFLPPNSQSGAKASANIATYLEPSGKERYNCYRKMKALYEGRAKSAQQSSEDKQLAYSEGHAIARRVLVKMIESRRVPDKKELEAGAFG